MFSKISGKRKTPSPEITLQESNKKQTTQSSSSSLIAQTALAPFSAAFSSASNTTSSSLSASSVKRKNSDDSLASSALKNQRVEQEDKHGSALPHNFRPSFFEPIAAPHSSVSMVNFSSPSFSSLSNAPSARPLTPFSGDSFQLMRDEQAEPDSDDEADLILPPLPESPTSNPANVPLPNSPAFSSQSNRMPEPEPEILGFGELSLGEPAQPSVTSALSNFSFSSSSTDASTTAFLSLLKGKNNDLLYDKD